MIIPKRDKTKVAVPKPAQGDGKTLLDLAFCYMFIRYEKALKDLA